jgi:hypothetical protein
LANFHLFVVQHTFTIVLVPSMVSHMICTGMAWFLPGVSGFSFLGQIADWLNLKYNDN